MRQIKLWPLALTTCLIPVSAIAFPHTQLNSTTLAQADRSPTQFNLSGQWVIKTQNYRVGEDGITCIPEPNTELTIEPIITQNGNQIDADPMTLIINEGSISGNSVYIRGEIFSLKGTISNLRSCTKVRNRVSCISLNLKTDIFGLETRFLKPY